MLAKRWKQQYLDFFFTLILLRKREKHQLINEIDDQTWIVDYMHRLQYYGYRNELEKPYHLVPFPVEMPVHMREFSAELVDKGIIQLVPDQVIINEYVPGEGIKPHKDRMCYENQICGVTWEAAVLCGSSGVRMRK